MLFLEVNKNDIFLRENNPLEKKISPFEHYNATGCAKTGTNALMLQFKLRHSLTSEKPKTANLINVLYKLMKL